MSLNENRKLKPIDLRHELSLRLQKIGERGQETYYICPFCGDKSPSKFSINHTKESSFHCYSCNEKGGGYKLLKHLGYNFKTKQDSFISYTDKIILEERDKKVSEKSRKKYPYTGVLFNSYTDETGREIRETVIPYQSFIYRDETGKEIYQRHVAHSGEFSKKKNKPKKVIRPTHKDENGKEWLGRGEEKDTFYGLETIQKESVCLIFEGEKKRDFFETSLMRKNSFNIETFQYETETLFSSLSSYGAEGKIDSRTLQALKNKQVKYIIIIPDMDKVGREFALQNKRILVENGIKTFILDLDFLLPPSIKTFEGYDIEDALKDSPKILKELLDTCKSEIDLKNIETVNSIDHTKHRLNIYSKYITDSIYPPYILKLLDEKIIIIKSIQGTGKTFFLEEMRKSGEKLVYVSPRESLCRDASERLGIEFYLNLEKESSCSVFDSELAVCLNSLHKFHALIKNIEGYVLCIDEIDNTIKDLMSSPLLRDGQDREFRSRIYAILIDLIKKAKRIILTSSDIPYSVLQFLEDNNLKDYFFIENEYKDDKKYVQYNSFELLLGEIKKEIDSNNKLSISLNCKNTAKKIKRYIEKHKPETRILFLEQKKTKQEAQILKERDFSEYDIVIFTPTIFTGVDFNIEFGLKHFMFITNNRTVNHFEALQSCFRFRKASEIHFYIKHIEGQKETDKEIIKQKALKKREELGNYSEYVKFGSLSSDLNVEMLNLYGEIESENNRSRNNLKIEFIKLVHSRIKNMSQYSIFGEIDYKTRSIEKEIMNNIKGLYVSDLIPIEFLLFFYDIYGEEIDIEKEKEIIRNIGVELKQIELEEILSAPLLNEKRVHELNSGSYHKDEKEKYSEIKTNYVNFTKIDSETEEGAKELKEIIEKTSFSSLVSSSKLTHSLVLSESELVINDAENLSSYIGDDSFLSLKVISTKQVLRELCPGIDFTTKETLISKPLKIDEKGLHTLSDRLQDSEYRKSLCLQLNIRETLKANYLMRTVLDSLGWRRTSSQKRTGKGEKRVREYNIDMEFLSKIFSFGVGVTDEQ